jgi:hypothetical protein
MSEEVEQGKIEGFDLRSVIRDPRTGKVIKEQHYTTHISEAYGTVMVRDGKFFAPNGQEIPDPKAVKVEQVEVKAEKKAEVSFTKKA